MMIRSLYIRTLGFIVKKLETFLMFIDNKCINEAFRKIGFYIFNFRVKHNIFD